MTPKTINQLQHFVGKVCSIVTTSMNRSFDERLSREHFVNRIRSLNQDGIWGSHPYADDLVSFFAWPHIISIHEEIELDPNDPQHAEIIASHEKRTGEKLVGDIPIPKAPEPSFDLLPVLNERPSAPEPEPTRSGDAAFVDIAALERLAENTKRTFASYEQFGSAP